MNWDTGKENLAGVLRRSFPNANLEEIDGWAQRIESNASIGSVVEDFSRRNRAPEKDAESLRAAISGLERAEKNLKLVGLIGDGVLSKALQKSEVAGIGHRGRYSADGLAQHFTEIRCAMELARDTILALPPGSDAFGLTFGPRFSEPTGRRSEKSKARGVARECGDAYRALTGHWPKLPTTNTIDNKASSPFMTLLAGVFDALGIDASAEAFNREVAKERSEQE
ncbi:hypothetical protein [Gymnodinialimonas sp.]